MLTRYLRRLSAHEGCFSIDWIETLQNQDTLGFYLSWPTPKRIVEVTESRQTQSVIDGVGQRH